MTTSQDLSELRQTLKPQPLDGVLKALRQCDVKILAACRVRTGKSSCGSGTREIQNDVIWNLWFDMAFSWLSHGNLGMPGNPKTSDFF